MQIGSSMLSRFMEDGMLLLRLSWQYGSSTLDGVNSIEESLPTASMETMDAGTMLEATKADLHL